MKIEGMQYPLVTPRVNAKGSDSVESAVASEDAVFFDPDEPHEEKRDEPNRELVKQEPAAEVELSVEIEQIADSESDGSELSRPKVVKNLPHAIDVLA